MLWNSREKKDIDAMEEELKEKEKRRKTKVKYKLDKKENKAAEKNRKRRIKTPKRWFNFFTKWFYIGIIMVLLSICLSHLIDKLEPGSTVYMFRYFLTILAGLISTIGIALFVGCIFDFSKNSEAFIAFVSDILSEIVVSKKFLSTLSVKDKEQALKLIIKPMDSQVEQYANINDYFKKRINEVMTMFDANFKANVILDIEVHKDYEKNIVYSDTILTYTIYKLNNKYQPVHLMFEKGGSQLIDVVVITPEDEIKIEVENPRTEDIGGITYLVYEMEIPPEYERFDHLKIQRTIREPGKDHWIHSIWQSLTPYEGVTCSVKCFDNLIVKDFMIFDNKAYYYTHISEDRKRLNINSTQWLEADTGFSFVIGEASEMEKALVEATAEKLDSQVNAEETETKDKSEVEEESNKEKFNEENKEH